MAYICLVHFLINVKTKMICKTDSYFIMFRMVGRIWIRERPHVTHVPWVENHCYRFWYLSVCDNCS